MFSAAGSVVQLQPPLDPFNPVFQPIQMHRLREGHFVDTAQNVLAFGLPGRGKTHVLCAVGHALVERGYRVLFTFLAERCERKSMLDF